MPLSVDPSTGSVTPGLRTTSMTETPLPASTTGSPTAATSLMGSHRSWAAIARTAFFGSVVLMK